MLLHFAAWAYVIWQQVQYDQGGFEGLIWWLVAFWILPAIGVLTLAASMGAYMRWLEE